MMVMVPPDAGSLPALDSVLSDAAPPGALEVCCPLEQAVAMDRIIAAAKDKLSNFFNFIFFSLSQSGVFSMAFIVSDNRWLLHIISLIPHIKFYASYVFAIF